MKGSTRNVLFLSLFLLIASAANAKLAPAAMFNSPAQCNAYVLSLANQVTQFKAYAWFEFFSQAKTSSTSTPRIRYINTGFGTIPNEGACGLFFPSIPAKFRTKILENLNQQILSYNASGNVQSNIPANYGLECLGGQNTPLSSCKLITALAP